MGNKSMLTDEEKRIRKNARSAQRYIEQKEKIKAYHAALYLAKKSDPDFMREMAAKTAVYRALHPEKTKQQNAKRRASDPEKSRKETREWFANNPHKRAVYEQNRRARKRANGGILSTDITDRLMSLQQGKCACCKKSIDQSSRAIDHIVPLSKGGRNEDKNVQLLCRTCNNQKHAKHPVEFMQEKGFLL